MKRMILMSVITLMLAGCGEAKKELVLDQQLNGEVVYLARILTPPGSQLKVRISDSDGTVLGEQQQEVQGGPPFPYQVDYAQGEAMTISASLYFDGTLKFQLKEQPLDTTQPELLLRGAD